MDSRCDIPIGRYCDAHDEWVEEKKVRLEYYDARERHMEGWPCSFKNAEKTSAVLSA
jgi:hypothetical protein